MSTLIFWLPHLIALCNFTTLLFLIIGFIHIRKGEEKKHKQSMMGAVGVAVLFLIFYTTYHSLVGNVAFAGQGSIRGVYFTILIFHVILAVIILPLVPLTLFKALKNQRDQHRKLARMTLPIWIIVSLSGLIVYIMAFHIYPAQ